MRTTADHKQTELASVPSALQSLPLAGGAGLHDQRPEAAVQQRQINTIQRKENKTGLPDNLKSGIENLSGMGMDDVRVHYNSSKPAQLNALAYAQGTDIHVASGQEKHLPHEAWHVVQQKQGRVKPTIQMKTGTPVNDDPGLEKEADTMGAKALQMKSADPVSPRAVTPSSLPHIVQRSIGFEIEAGSVLSGRRVPEREEEDSLPKKTRLLTGNGFSVEADELGQFSDVEFVIDPVDETPQGAKRLQNVIQTIVRFTQAADNLVTQRSSEVSLSRLNAFGSPSPYTYMDPSRGWLAQIQATAGVSINSLFALLGTIANPERADPLEREEKENEREPLIHSEHRAIPEPRHLMGGDDQLGAVHRAVTESMVRSSGAVKGFVTLIAYYLVRGAHGTPEYGKTISGALMARTNFAHIFMQLPLAERRWFQANPQRLVSMVLTAVRAADDDHEYTSDSPVFSGGLYTNKEHLRENAPDMSRLTIGNWLTRLVPPPSDNGILTRLIGNPIGTDLLTATNFPGSEQAKKEIESLGSYGHKKDTRYKRPPTFLDHVLGTGHLVEHLPIFELRGLKSIMPEHWSEYTQGVLHMLMAINQHRR